MTSRKDQADEIRALLIELTGDRIRAVIEFLHCLVDLINCLLAQVARLFKTRETVVTETPASLATSWSFTLAIFVTPLRNFL